MELLTLPHGQRLRLDLLERRVTSRLLGMKQQMQSVTMNFSGRFQTMATTLAVDVLGCTGTTEERAGLLHKMIQIAAELKSTMGNMFGFAAIMRALELPQVRSQTTLMPLWPLYINTATSPFILKETAHNHHDL